MIQLFKNKSLKSNTKRRQGAGVGAGVQSAGVSASLQSAEVSASLQGAGVGAGARSAEVGASLQGAGVGASLRSAGVSAGVRSAGVGVSVQSAGVGAGVRSAGICAGVRSAGNKSAKKQKGRSMVEMLGVLAIIGVLSIGGIQGYTIAMRKYRANEVLNLANKYAFILYDSCQKAREIDPENYPIEAYEGIPDFFEWKCPEAISFANSGLGSLPAGITEIKQYPKAYYTGSFPYITSFNAHDTVGIVITFDNTDLCLTTLNTAGNPADSFNDDFYNGHEDWQQDSKKDNIASCKHDKTAFIPFYFN